jgi:hypothetical protein
MTPILCLSKGAPLMADVFAYSVTPELDRASMLIRRDESG